MLLGFKASNSLWQKRHGVVILADINTLFLFVVMEIRNSFSDWELYAGLSFFAF